MIFSLGKSSSTRELASDKTARLSSLITAAGMDEARNIQLDHLFPKGIPIFIPQCRRAVVAFARVGVDQQSDEAQLFHAALQLRKAERNRLAGRLRRRAHALETAGKRLDLLGNVIVIGHRPGLHHFQRLFGMHELKRTRRQELNVGSHRIHDAQIALGIRMIANIFVAEFFGSVAVRSARRHLHRLPLVELRRGANMRVNIDDHRGHGLIFRGEVIIAKAWLLPYPPSVFST
jgi:hypothetical protein